MLPLYRYTLTPRPNTPKTDWLFISIIVSFWECYIYIKMESYRSYNLLRLYFFTRYNALKLHSNCCMCSVVLFIGNGVPFYGCITFIWPVTHGRMGGIAFVLGYYKQSRYEPSYVGLCVNLSFHFSTKKPSSTTPGSSIKCMFNFLRNCPTNFEVTVPFFIPTSNRRGNANLKVTVSKIFSKSLKKQ